MNFNTKQKKVIYAEEPKILCLAAAASGKTRTLTERVRALIEENGVDPEGIVAISFTNMAADEMKRRIGGAAAGSFIGTIHSYGNKICTMNGIDKSNNRRTWIGFWQAFDSNGKEIDFDFMIKRNKKVYYGKNRKQSILYI